MAVDPIPSSRSAPGGAHRSFEAAPAAAAAAPSGAGWLRSPAFDLLFVVGIAALALASGAVVVVWPHLFPVVLFVDIWLLGYHHVVSTYTRLTFDGESFAEHRFLVLVLPLIVVAGVVAATLAVGPWILATTYLYWQWFHYTRQSYGIERIYRRKAGGGLADARLTTWALYLVPLWGILYRSAQAPETFLGMRLEVLPVPWLLVHAVGAVAMAVLAFLVVRTALAWRRSRTGGAHTLYLTSHFLIFLVGYIAIPSIDHGWLVVNVWHNGQYILLVWMFNNNRFKGGVEPRHRLLSTLSQKRYWPAYLAVCLGISTVLYFGIDHLAGVVLASSLPVFLITYQTINFHHYIVDGLIWKVRKKPLQTHLGLSS